MGLRPRAHFARVELRYDLLLKPRNVHVDFTVIIHCNSFLIDKFVWKISYVNIFPNLFRWKVGWIIVAFLIIWEEILIWKPVFASANSFTITADEFQDSMIVNFSESQIRKDAEITTFKFFSDVLTSIDAGGILICSLKKIIGDKKLLFNERVIISWHTLGRTWIFGVHQLPTEKVVLSLDYPTWIW